MLPPGSDRWLYVKVGYLTAFHLRPASRSLIDLVFQPLPGHAICNIGDALNIFSGGILRSNIHRVVCVFHALCPAYHLTHTPAAYRPPPKDQAQYERWSLVFFTRPNDTAILHHLGDQSALIAAAVARAAPGKYAPGVTAQEWLMRRIRSQRVSQYKVRPIICPLEVMRLTGTLRDHRVRRAGRSGGGQRTCRFRGKVTFEEDEHSGNQCQVETAFV